MQSAHRQRKTPNDLLWQVLEKNNIPGCRFERHYKMGNFVLDFFCPSAGLAIEIERVGHETRRIEDDEREERIRACGLRLLRIPEEMVRDHSHAVRNTIIEELS